MTIADKRFDEARAIFAVANTPLFLLRKLQADSTVLQLSREASADKLLDLLKSVVSIEKSNPSVLPYVFLVALALKRDIVSLRKATAIVLSYSDTWLLYMAQVLVETFSPTGMVEIKVPTASQTLADQPNMSSNGTVSFKILATPAAKP